MIGMRRLANLCLLVTGVVASGAIAIPGRAVADDQWVVYEGQSGPGKGKHIVLVSGDEEYRSEEALPMLGKLLAVHHGFKCTVLFAIDPATGEINPQKTDNIPGLEALKTADLMIIATRFRNLPDEQMKPIDDFLKAGKPVIGLRTATHAFNIPGNREYARFGNGSNVEGWKGGFGRAILGEKWVNHHGHHGKESCRGIIVPEQKAHPILKGLKDGDVWGPSDVYTVTALPGDSQPLLLGQVLKGMKKDDEPVDGPKNAPMMPLAWTKTYSVADGKTGRVFTTTLGAATDLTEAGSRRLVVNAVYWTLGMESQITDSLNVDLVGEYTPRPFSFGGHAKGIKPADLKLK